MEQRCAHVYLHSPAPGLDLRVYASIHNIDAATSFGWWLINTLLTAQISRLHFISWTDRSGIVTRVTGQHYRHHDHPIMLRHSDTMTMTHDKLHMTTVHKNDTTVTTADADADIAAAVTDDAADAD